MGSAMFCLQVTGDATPLQWIARLALLPLIAVSFAAAQPAGPVPAWIRSHAVALKTVDAGKGFDDLRPLKAMIGDARIVALGEATHGASEFFRMKHRLVEFLNAEMGFTVFSIEAPMPDAYALNDYVLDGKGDPRELLKPLSGWHWNAQEILEFVEWMRRYNRTAKVPLQFTGFDMQRTPADIERWQGIVNRLAGKEASVEDTAWAVRNARVVLQAMQARAGQQTRDQSMAENVKWILEQNPRAKIILWAHNGHVSYKPIRGFEPAGRYLREMFGDAYRCVGFNWYEGAFRASEPGKPVSDHAVEPSPAGTVEATMAAAGLPLFALNLRTLPDSGPVAEWFRSEHKARQSGPVYNPANLTAHFNPMILPDTFDILLFVKATTPSRQP
jgi:erythromycin esterase